MKKIVAVCACPMGLAHTFMAADSLEKAARELGVEIKIRSEERVSRKHRGQMEFRMNLQRKI